MYFQLMQVFGLAKNLLKFSVKNKYLVGREKCILKVWNLIHLSEVWVWKAVCVFFPQLS